MINRLEKCFQNPDNNKKHLSENSYDIIHSVLPFDFADVYQPRGGSFAESILRNAASYQNKFIARYKRLTAFANFRRTILLRAERKLCKNPNGPIIAALSQYVAEQFKRHYGLNDERLIIVPNGVETNKRTSAGHRRKASLSGLTAKKLKITHCKNNQISYPPTVDSMQGARP